MSSDFGKIFGAILAVILLLLYATTLAFLVVHVINCGADATCTKPFAVTGGTVFVFTTVSGLISALVVASLAATDPGENPSKQWVGENASEASKKKANYIVAIYLAVWVLAGLTALIVGVMIYPNANQTLSDAGTTWLGIAVAAGYAYFGIKPKN